MAAGIVVCLLLLGVGASRAAGAPAEAHMRSHKGLGPGVKVPAWAVHAHVHFFKAAASSGSTLASPFPGAKLDNRFEPSPGSDRPLIYNGGPVQHESHVYAIFWGANWNLSGNAESRTKLLKLYETLHGTTYAAILEEYFDTGGRITGNAAVTAYTDTSVSAPSELNDTKIQAEVTKAITANAWKADAQSQFVVLTAPGSTSESSFGEGFCAYHDVLAEGGWSYTFVPYAGDEPYYAGCSAYDAARNVVHVTSMAAAHEFFESATDPALNAWYTQAEGAEIADMCATVPATTEIREGALTGSWVQPEWSNTKNVCSVSDTEPHNPELQGVTTSPAAGYSVKALHMSGIVAAEGHESTYQFEYGATSAYGSSYPAVAAGAGSAYTNFTADQTAPEVPEGIYHYRLTASNSTGTVRGEDRLGVSLGFFTHTLPVGEAGSQINEAEAISCVLPEKCMAVGSYRRFLLSAAAPYSATWEGPGTSWTVRAVPIPVGGAEGVLSGVSCTSATQCTGVGYYTNSAGTRMTLAARWNGSTWSAQTTPNPSGAAESVLQGVACASSSLCVAAGYYKNSAGARVTLTERWSESAWSVVSSPNPAGASESRLQAISCAATNNCVAVGYSADASEKRSPLAETWNGTSWALASPVTANWATLKGVSCSSTISCTAVGLEVSSTGVALVEHWNGSAWTAESVPEPAPTNGVELKSVSCTSATSCSAVGAYESTVNTDGSGLEKYEVISERWNGTAWKITGMAGESPSGSIFDENEATAVSCTEALVCVATGRNSGAIPETTSPLYMQEAMAPVATTEAATAITGSGATLVGFVNPEGLETHYKFEYGTTTSYGSTVPTPEGYAGTAVGHDEVTQTIAGLSANTVYHYRLVATNAEGTTYGGDRVITAINVVPAVKNPAAAESCPATTFCLEVGNSVSSASGNSVADYPTAREWNGSEWVVSPSRRIATPTSAEAIAVNGASCSSSELCTAVGRYTDGSGVETPLAERLASGTWSLQSVPSPTEGTGAALLGASCPSATACTSVGYYVRGAEGPRPLAEHWNGSSWSLQIALAPTGTNGDARLLSVACPSTTECIATGYYRFLEGGLEHRGPLAERWTGGSAWSILTTPTPSEGRFTQLSSISCVSASSCWAVGYSESSTGVANTLTEHWNGSAWAIQSSPNPAEGKANTLAAVSCTSATACTAVGHYKNSAGVEVTLAERWNGSAWAVQSTANPTGATGSALLTVSCASSESCAAAGDSLAAGKLEAPLAESWNGTAWSTIAMSSAQSVSTGVSCGSATFCISVGDSTDASVQVGEFGLAREWNGAEWKLPGAGTAAEDPVRPASFGDTQLNGVSCAPASVWCYAVGEQYSSGKPPFALAERRAGEWATQSIPIPAEGTTSKLSGVSCSAPLECTAVGSYEKTGVTGPRPMIARLSGSTWSLQTSPSLTEEAELLSVACPSASECVAVGYDQFSEAGVHHYGTLAERWNGTEWIKLTTPNPSGGRYNKLLGISCGATSSCEAVGYTQTESGTVTTLAESWNGTSWTLQTSPNQTGSNNVLSAVSCTSAAACTAVGHYKNTGGTEEPLAASWNGTAWSLRTVFTPAENKASALSGVSCTSVSSSCVAVGGYTTTAGKTEANFAEILG
jgi:hypothetical protein